jgi:hypothetical protein
MKIRWHHQAFTGIAIALYLILVRFLVAGQGWYTVQLFGSDYGMARMKSFTFLVLGGEMFRFPFDTLAFLGAVIGLGIAVAAAWSHFKSRSTVTNFKKP